CDLPVAMQAARTFGLSTLLLAQGGAYDGNIIVDVPVDILGGYIVEVGGWVAGGQNSQLNITRVEGLQVSSDLVMTRVDLLSDASVDCSAECSLLQMVGGSLYFADGALIAEDWVFAEGNISRATVVNLQGGAADFTGDVTIIGPSGAAQSRGIAAAGTALWLNGTQIYAFTSLLETVGIALLDTTDAVLQGVNINIVDNSPMAIGLLDGKASGITQDECLSGLFCGGSTGLYISGLNIEMMQSGSRAIGVALLGSRTAVWEGSASGGEYYSNVHVESSQFVTGLRTLGVNDLYMNLGVSISTNLQNAGTVTPSLDHFANYGWRDGPTLEQWAAADNKAEISSNAASFMGGSITVSNNLTSAVNGYTGEVVALSLLGSTSFYTSGNYFTLSAENMTALVPTLAAEIHTMATESTSFSDDTLYGPSMGLQASGMGGAFIDGIAAGDGSTDFLGSNNLTIEYLEAGISLSEDSNTSQTLMACGLFLGTSSLDLSESNLSCSWSRKAG
ncbi:hypothetical protein KAI87_01205, partial [Myxococcota bacterium]|nr:hypothetical protein [Myxococcota bacterium]